MTVDPRRKSADIILLPKQLRMDWMDVMATDPAITPVEFKIGGAIGSHFGNKSGFTYVSLKLIAKVSGVSESTAARAALRLERRGYLIVERREIGVRGDGRPVYGGKGVANVYLPAVNAQQVSATDRGQRLIASVEAKWAAAKHVTSDVLPRSKHVTDDVLSETLSMSSGSPKHVAGDVPTLSSPSEKNSLRPREPSFEGLGSFGAEVRRRIGPNAYGSWFAKASVVAEAPETLTVVFPTKFLADSVRSRFDVAMHDSAKAVDPRIIRVNVVTEAGDGLP